MMMMMLMMRNVAMILSTLFLLLLLAGASSSGASQKPNILFLMVDEMDGRALGESSPVLLPNLEKLMKRGTSFANTYVASPQCVPSRVTLFTGRHTSKTKTWSNMKGLSYSPRTGKLDEACVKYYNASICTRWKNETRGFTTTIVDMLIDAGYTPRLYGKLDIGANVLSHPYAKFGNNDGFHGGASLITVSRTADIRKATRASPLEATDDEYNDWAWPVDAQTARNCSAFLKRAASTPPSQPFFLYCSFNAPHPPFLVNRTWTNFVSEERIEKLPTWLSPDAMHPADSYMSIAKSMLSATGSIQFNATQIKKVRRAYYGMVAQADYLVGSVLKTLESLSNLNSNTLIVFLSDHGDMAMQHRQYLKNSMYEASTRVPLVFAGNGIPRGKTIQGFASLLDVLPTLIDVAGADVPARIRNDLDGISLVPVMMKNESMLKGRCVASQYHSNEGNTGSFMLRCESWKYIAFGRTDYPPQLFNLVEDPEELVDLAKLAEYSGIVGMMDARLVQEIGNYEMIDKEAVACDCTSYDTFFLSKNRSELKSAFQRSYSGFDDADWEKVQQWYANICM